MTPQNKRQIAARAAQRAVKNYKPMFVADAAIEKTHCRLPENTAYTRFRADPSPANAVALARANFQKEHGQSDSQFIDALQLAEMLLRDKDANAFAPST